MKLTHIDKWTVYPGRTPLNKQSILAFISLGLGLLFVLCVATGLFENSGFVNAYGSLVRRIEYFSVGGILAILFFSFGCDMVRRHEINTQTLLRIVLIGILGLTLI